MQATGELIRLLTYVDDIAATLRRITSTIRHLRRRSASAWPRTCASPIQISLSSSKV